MENEGFALGFNEDFSPVVDDGKMWFGFLALLLLSGNGNLDERLDSWEAMFKKTKDMVEEIKKEHEHE